MMIRRFSHFEVAFNGLATRFLAPNLTPGQLLVVDEQQEIVGVAAEHFSYVASSREGSISHYFYSHQGGADFGYDQIS